MEFLKEVNLSHIMRKINNKTFSCFSCVQLAKIGFILNQSCKTNGLFQYTYEEFMSIWDCQSRKYWTMWEENPSNKVPCTRLANRFAIFEASSVLKTLYTTLLYLLRSPLYTFEVNRIVVTCADRALNVSITFWKEIPVSPRKLRSVSANRSVVACRLIN